MSYLMLQGKDFMRLAMEVVGKKREITIDTGIFHHSNNRESDEEEDIMKLAPNSESNSKYLELSDIMRVIEYMEYQLEIVQESGDRRCYRYGGLEKDEEISNLYHVWWGS